MLSSTFNDRITLVWNIKNIDEPTKSDIVKYIDHGFWKIDSYLDGILSRTSKNIILHINLEKKWKDYVDGSLLFDLPDFIQDVSVSLTDQDHESLPHVVAELFDKAKHALGKALERLKH